MLYYIICYVNVYIYVMFNVMLYYVCLCNRKMTLN